MTSTEHTRPVNKNEVIRSVVYHSETFGESKISEKHVQSLQATLFSIVKSYSVPNKDQNWNHNAQNLPKGKYFITAQNIGKYYKGLCDLVEVDGMCGMMEKNEPQMPVIVDNDFDFAPTSSDSNPPIMYEPWVIKEQIKVYQEQIRACCNGVTDKSVICCVFEKTGGYMKKGFVHNGFHLMFPFAVIDANDQQRVLHSRVNKALSENRLLERMEHKDIKQEGWSKILDPGLPKKTWVQYGCRKDNNSEPYKLTGIYNHLMEKISVAEAFNPSECWFVKKGMIPRSFFDGHPPEYYLPLYLSVRAWSDSSVLEIKKEILEGLPPTRVKPKSKCTCNGSASAPCGTCLAKANQVTVPLIKLQQVVEMLSAERADSYPEWWPVGCAIYNSSGGSEAGLELWKKWSQLSSKYDESGVEKSWETMTIREDGTTMGSLRKWAKEDSPLKYAVWKTDDDRERAEVRGMAVPDGIALEGVDSDGVVTKPKLTIKRRVKPGTREYVTREKALSGTHADVGRYIYSLYGDEFSYSDSPAGWYSFTDHHWKLVPKDNLVLKARLSNEVCDKLKDWMYEVHGKAKGLEKDSDEQKELLEQVDRIAKLCILLSDVVYKGRIMTQLTENFFIPDLTSGFDLKADLLCFPNGVYDLVAGEFRPGRKDDLCSKCSLVNYLVDASEETPSVIAVREYLREVFVDTELRAYIIRWFSSMLHSGNVHKLFHQFIGEKDNSKSQLCKILQHGLGSYYVPLNQNTLIMQKLSSTEATTDLNGCVGAKLVVMQEVPKDKEVNYTRLKEVTGGDPLALRFLYGEVVIRVNTANWVGVSNGVMDFSKACPAVWTRARIVPFDSTFFSNRDEVPKSRDEQFKLKKFYADPHFGNRIPDLASALMWVLVQEHKKYREEGLLKCNSVEVATLNYRTTINPFALFKDQRLVASGNSQTGVSKKKLHDAFVKWCKGSHRSGNITTPEVLCDGLNALLGRKADPVKMKYLKGWDLAEEEKDEYMPVAQIELSDTT